jgi:hypothetical protein
MGWSEKNGIGAQGRSSLSNVNINKDVDISKMGESDMPFYIDPQVREDSPSWGPSLDHCGATPWWLELQV